MVLSLVYVALQRVLQLLFLPVHAPEANGIAERFVRSTSPEPRAGPTEWSAASQDQKRPVNRSMCDGVTGFAAAPRVRARGVSEIGFAHPTRII